MTSNIAVAQINILDWVHELAAIPEDRFTLQNVQEFVLQHGVRPDSLGKYLHFSAGCYTRNLVFKNALFECMTVCWEVGQHSRIHNHRDQNCWMSVPIGHLRVQNYRVDNRDAAHGTCKLQPTDVFDMDATHPAYVDPMEPVHEVMNLKEFAQRAVSVHIYSKPFDICEVYQRDRGTYSDVPLFYTSVYGELTAEEKPL